MKCFIELKGDLCKVENITYSMVYREDGQRDALVIKMSTENYNFESISQLFLNLKEELKVFDEDRQIQGIHKYYTHVDRIQYCKEPYGTDYYEITIYRASILEQQIASQNEELEKYNELGKKTIAELATTRINMIKLQNQINMLMQANKTSTVQPTVTPTTGGQTNK